MIECLNLQAYILYIIVTVLSSVFLQKKYFFQKTEKARKNGAFQPQNGMSEAWLFLYNILMKASKSFSDTPRHIPKNIDKFRFVCYTLFAKTNQRYKTEVI